MFRCVIFSAFILLAAPVLSADMVKVVGLFKNAAIVQVAGKQVMLKKGVLKKGILLVSADAESAVIKYQGAEKRYYLQTSIGGTYVKPTFGEVIIAKDRQRRYFTAGSINGQPVGFIVDTGATSVAMSGNQATKLGIDYRLVGREGQAVTASGVTRSYSLKLKRVKVGNIELKEVDAAVIDGDFPKVILLGMSFLERVEMSEENGVMRLKKNY